MLPIHGLLYEGTRISISVAQHAAATRRPLGPIQKKYMNKPTAKVLIRNVFGYDETFWAFDLGNNVYKLASSPFFAYGVSYQDEVIATAKNKGDIPEFIRIYRKSGNRTIRITGYKEIEKGRINEQVIKDIKEFGCSVEGSSRKYKSVNIPSDVDIQTVVNYLIRHNQRWEYADPTFEEIKKNKRNR